MKKKPGFGVGGWVRKKAGKCRMGGRVGWGRGVRGRSWGAQLRPGYRWASAIDRISKIRNVVARASGMDLASSLKQNKFWMRGCVSGGLPCGGPGSGVRAGRGDAGGPRTGGHGGPPDGAW